MEKIKIIIGGDLVPTKSNEMLFENKNLKELFGEELIEILEHSDIRIFNLEAPITYKNAALDKCGPNLKISPKTIGGIKALNPSILNLANNHIMDFKKQGLNDTIETLHNNNIDYIGVGKNLLELKNTHIFNLKSKKIGIYGCAEHEFSIAAIDKAGAEPFDSINSYKKVRELKEKCDFVIVLYHGGKEHYRYPSPELKKICNSFVEYGADLIVCQHSHCIGCFENYKTGTIIYGQGNFIFDNSTNEYWKTSLLIELELKDKKVLVNYIPIVKKGNIIRLANTKEKQNILDEFYKRSEEILEKNFIEKKYKEFALKNVYNYLYSLSMWPKIIIRVDGRLLNNILVKVMYRKKIKKLAALNFIECEAHRELFIAGLKELLKDKG